MVEIEYVGKIVDAFDKATGSFDELQPEQVDLNYVHALNEAHLHEIHVVPSKHEVDQHFSYGRQNSLAAGTSRQYISGPSENNSGKQRTVVCYNCKGEGHMSKQCTKPKRKRGEVWFKDKVLLVQDQANEQILYEEELEFLADTGIAEAQTT
nr:hypothetical protein [Tanacetum cinerariifolium]